MNILLLSNSAPNYFNFFNELAKRFAQDGAHVFIAVDSKFSKEENGLDALGFDVNEFTSFFASHKIDDTILQRYAKFNLNSALLSDFERAEVYQIWGKNINQQFYDRLKSALLTFFENLFEKHCIDIVIFENVSNTFAHFAMLVAKNNGAIYCGIGGSRLPGRFSITEDPLEDEEPRKIFAEINAGRVNIPDEVKQWAFDYLNTIETVTPDYMKINGLEKLGLLTRYFRRDRIKKLRSLLRHSCDSRTDAFQIGNPLLTHFNLFSRNARRRFKVGIIRKLYETPRVDERFLLYPMHFHPESSTSILAGTYLDEYEVIRNIAFNLPEGIRLYVKDHISAWGYPSLEFYRKIKRLPNVRLLSPTEPTKQLIKQSAGVITLTSTVGYEALLLNTRVFLLGRVFYEFHKGVMTVENPKNLFDLLKLGTSTPVNWDAEYNINFISAYQMSTLPGSLNLMQSLDQAVITINKLYPAIKGQVLTRLSKVKNPNED